MRYKVHITYSSNETLLRRAVESVRDMGNIHIWADGRYAPGFKDVDLHEPGRVGIVPLINMCMKESALDDVMFWMHDDAEAAPGIAKKFLDYVTARQFEHWGWMFTNGDKLSAINMRAVYKVGPWDTMFFQYGADMDYRHRLRMAGWPPVPSTVEFEWGVTHPESRERDPDHERKLGYADPFWRHYYEEKWGGPPGHEVCAVPFSPFSKLRLTHSGRNG